MATDERTPLRRIALRLFLPLALVALVPGSCEPNHDRRHDHHPVEVTAPGGVPVRLAPGATERVDADSSGTWSTRWAGPYRVRVRARPPTGTTVEALDVRLVGLESGKMPDAPVSERDMSVGDSLSYFRTDDLELPYEDYRIRVRVRTVRDGRETVGTVTGVPRNDFQAESSFAFRDGIMSV